MLRIVIGLLPVAALAAASVPRGAAAQSTKPT
jgi:hypothetical protein